MESVGDDILEWNQLVMTFLGRISWWRLFGVESVGGDIQFVVQFPSS